MTFNYTLVAADFLDYYLYRVSKSAAISRKRNFLKYLFPVIYVGFAIYFFAMDRIAMGWFFVILANLWRYFYPILNRKSLERYYAKYTLENFGQQMNRQVIMKIEPSAVSIDDGNVKNHVSRTEIEKITETQNNFFLFEKTGNAFVIPKNQLDRSTFVNAVSILDIRIADETKWKWR